MPGIGIGIGIGLSRLNRAAFRGWMSYSDTTLTAVPASDTAMDLAWTNPVIAGVTLKNVVVEISTDGVTFTTSATLGVVTSTQVTGLTAGTLYYFRLAFVNSRGVRTGNGAIVFNRAAIWGNNVYVKSAVSKDTYIRAINPTYNFGASKVEVVGHSSSNNSKYRALLKFDAIPSLVSSIVSHLWICNTQNGGTNTALLQLFGIKREWIEGTGNGSATGDGATWNKYDPSNDWETAGALGAGDYDNTILGEIEVPQTSGTSANGWIPVPITQITKFTESNNDKGILLKHAAENADLHSYSSKSGTYPPYLKINGLVNGTYNPLAAKLSENPLIEDNSAFGSIVYVSENNYAFFYPNLGINIYRVNSTDGITWGEPTIVLSSATGDLEVCTAWKEGENWFMLYRSSEWVGAGRSIGLATSSDGNTWTKYANNPVIDASDVAWATQDRIDPWGIIKVESTYYLWVNNVNDVPRQTGLFTSTDLINWTPNANNPIFDNGRYCVMPFKYLDKYYMLVPYTPNGNIAGADPWAYRIELYRCADPLFLPADREFLGNIIYGGEDTEWDDDYLDTPSVLTTDIYRDTFPLGNNEDGKLWIYYTGHNGLTAITGWSHGLAVGHLEMLPLLQAIDEPEAGK